MSLTPIAIIICTANKIPCLRIQDISTGIEHSDDRWASCKGATFRNTSFRFALLRLVSDVEVANETMHEKPHEVVSDRVDLAKEICICRYRVPRKRSLTRSLTRSVGTGLQRKTRPLSTPKRTNQE